MLITWVVYITDDEGAEYRYDILAESARMAHEDACDSHLMRGLRYAKAEVLRLEDEGFEENDA